MKHELLWTMDSFFVERGNETARAYCLCGWVADGNVTANDMRLSFIKHLEELRHGKKNLKTRRDRRIL